MGITATGIGSGLDVNSIVTQLVAAERTPGDKRLTTSEQNTKSQISAFGSMTSTLSALETALKAFNGSGILAGRKTTVATGAGFAATASSSASPGRYQISVESLAQAHRLQSTAVARNGDGSAAQVGYGTLAISVGSGDPINVTVEQGTGTLANIRDAINAQAGDKVAATVVSGDAGDVLFISSRTAGSDGAVSIVASGGDGGLAPLDTSSGTITTKDAAQDAQVLIDGITRTAKGNTISDAITGINLTLTSAHPATTFALEVTEDPTSLKTTLSSFVTAYNAAIGQIRTLSAAGGQDAVAGPLSGDTAPRGILQTLRNTIGNSYSDLSSLGLKTAVDGTISLDSTKFDAALAADPGAVKKLFSETSDFGKGMRDLLHNYLGDQGLLAGRRESLDVRTKTQAKQRTDFEARMTQIEATYRRQFTALDTMMAQLQGTASYVSQQMAMLNK